MLLYPNDTALSRVYAPEVVIVCFENFCLHNPML